MERELLDLGPKDVVLTISSAGCNVLDYLIEGPKAIVACDFNSAQLACLELKLAGIVHGSYEDFWQMWAESCDDTFQRVYHGPGGLREKILASRSATCEATAGAILSGLSISKSLTAATASILTDVEFGGGEAEQIDGSNRDLRTQLPGAAGHRDSS